MHNPFRGMNMGMMPPWMMPMMIAAEQRPSSLAPEIIVPARVNKAMEFLAHLAEKRRKGAAVSDNAIETLIPDDLSNWEVRAQDSALQLLSSYFDGKLEPDQWEQIRVDALKRTEDERDREITLIRCPACNPFTPNPKCPLCHGHGRLMTKAVGPPVEAIGEQQEPKLEGDESEERSQSDGEDE